MRDSIEPSRNKNSKFEAKLKQLLNKVSKRENIGIDLMGILDSETDMEEIHKRAELELMRAISMGGNNYHIVESRIIVVSLSLIAMLNYDGNFYDNVCSIYTKAYSWYSKQKVEGVIRNILSKYRRAGTSSSRMRIINVVLENAIVPQAFLPAFFEFIFDIYKINFEYDLPDDPHEDFKFVYEGLRNNMNLNKDDISVNVTRKTYKLIASTKQLIEREESLDPLVELSVIVVKLLDKYYWREEVIIPNSYLKFGYEGWKKQLWEPSQTDDEHRKSSSELRSRWEPNFFMTNNFIYLVPPKHRVKAQYNYKDIAIEVLNDNEEIYRKDDCYIKEVIGGYQINPPKIEIEKPLGKLTYRLVCAEEVIYDSRDKLHRDYIVFNEEGREIDNNTDFEGTAYICHRAENIEFKNILDEKFYSIGYKLVKSGDTISVGRDVFSFSSVLKPGILGKLHKNCFLSKAEENEKIDVYERAEALFFEADNTSDKFEILINSRPHKLSEMGCTRTSRESITKYKIALDLKESDIYTVEVNQIIAGGNKNRIFRTSFAYDPELRYQKEEIDQGIYKVTVSSGILAEEITEEISVSNFKSDFISFDHAGKLYSYLLPFDFGFYKINDGSWNKASDELWIGDVPLEATMYVLNSKCDGLSIYSENRHLIDENIVVQDKGIYKSISIGFLNSYRISNKYVSLVFAANDKVENVIRCYNSSVIDEEKTEILLLDKTRKIEVTPVFYGKNPVFFEVLNNRSEKICRSKMLKTEQTETVEELNSFEEYSINFYEEAKGLTLAKDPICQIKKVFYIKQDFVGKNFQIKKIYFHKFTGESYDEKEFRFNRAYVHITDILRDESFRGKIFIQRQKGPWWLDRINPVDIELCSDVIDDTIDVYITNTNNGDGLLFYDGKILNSLEHKNAPDIYLYTLSLKGAVKK